MKSSKWLRATPTLLLEEMLGTISIVFEDRKGFLFEIEGQNAEDIAGVALTKAKNTRTLTAPIPCYAYGSAQASTSGLTTPFMYGHAEWKGKYIQTACALTIRVLVPLGTKIVVKNVIGAVTIADLSGSLSIENHADTSIKVGNVGSDAYIRNCGYGKITAQSVFGTANVVNQGTGMVFIANGTTRLLEATLSSSGPIVHGGEVVSAHMINQGSATLTLQKVIGGEVSALLKTIGSIRILNGECKWLDVITENNGDFSFHGHANDGICDVQLNGGITVSAMARMPEIRGNGHRVVIDNVFIQESPEHQPG